MQRYHDKKKSSNLPTGGVATSTGMDYEFRVAAWFAVHILAEQDASLPWNLPAKVTFENLRLETEFPIDDILVTTSNSGKIFIQVKHNLKLEKRQTSGLASAIDQIVRQFITGENPESDSSHLLRPDFDRFVLITSPNASFSISNTTKSLIEHLHNQSAVLQISQKEHEDYQILISHIKQSWNSVLGSDPSESEIRKILDYFHVFVLDVDKDGKDELFCKYLLRTSVLKNSREVEVAWTTLISHCAGLARSRGGSNRIALQLALINAGINIKIPNSFREDVERLKGYTKLTVESVSPLSKIIIGSNEIKVTRPYIPKIRKAIQDSHLLVVGEPGAGKSGVLHDLVALLLEKKEDVVFFAADRISSSNLSEETGISETIPKILQNWPGVRPGYLVIDALDGARNEQTAQYIETLIEKVISGIPRWHVIAAVRKFDLRHNLELRALFCGEPIDENMDPEFASIKHINIKDFNEHELDQIRSQSEILMSLLETKNHPLAQLLNKPFNLRLIGELIGEGISADKFTPIRTQVELLSKYWLYRVVRNDGFVDARELVLRRVAEEMLRERSLRVERSLIVQEVNVSQYLKELLSSHVLVEWQPSPMSLADRYVIAFSHNMLFDYAISVLIFSGNCQRLVNKLEEDHELVLAVRPSIVYYFHDLWSKDPNHDRFWEAIAELMKDNEVPLIGKLIGPSVAVDLATKLTDFDFVFAKLEDKNQSYEELAYRIIRDITGAVITFLPESDTADPEILILWGQFIERISRSMNLRIAYSIRAILIKLTKQPKLLTAKQKIDLGKAARRLLEYAWSSTGSAYEEVLVTHALQAVCRTYESSLYESKKLIQKSLEPSHLQRYGFLEMPRITDEIELLIANDPELVEEIYIKVFSYKESSEEKTSMGGRILNLQSTKRQDFQMAQWRLGEAFQFFIKSFPIEAIRSLLTLIPSYIAEKHEVKNKHEFSFMLGGIEARTTTDLSAIWDSRSDHHGDDQIRLLNIFSSFLCAISAVPESDLLLEKIITLIAINNHTAVIWKRLLEVAAGSPYRFGKLIRSMAWAKPILEGIDTTNAAGNFVREIYDYLETSEKIKVEETILSIPKGVSDDLFLKHAMHDRNRLLGVIADKKLITAEARKVAEELLTTKSVPPNTPPFSIESSWSKPYSDEDYLKEQGVSLNSDEDKRVIGLQKDLKEFVSKHSKEIPSLSEANDILPKLLELEMEDLRVIESIDNRIRDLTWGYIAQTCERIANIVPLDNESQLGKNVRRLLMIGADYPTKAITPEQNDQFSKFPSWGSPAARIDSASGLILLARSPNFYNPVLSGYIERLARDEDPAVRFQIAARLNVLIKVDPVLTWRNLKYFATEEKNNGVIKGIFHPLNRLAGGFPDEVAELCKSIFAKTIEADNDADSISNSCISIFLGLYLWRDQKVAEHEINDLLENQTMHPKSKVHIVSQLRDVISEYKSDAVRIRAVGVLETIVQSNLEHFLKIQECLNQTNSTTEEDTNNLKDIISLADVAASTIYFSSGTFAEKESKNAKGKILSIEEKRIFFTELSPIILSLSKITYASVTHHLVETLEGLIPANPRGVFVMVNSVVKSGKQGGYQYESLAVDHIVHIVERYLAEYRLTIRENDDCQSALLEILDIFVEAGWPNARKLTYRLEEIYR
jgi:hypothetical protein